MQNQPQLRHLPCFYLHIFVQLMFRRGSLCWLEDTEEIRTDEYDGFDASVDQVI
jgi:hypothetical protein